MLDLLRDGPLTTGDLSVALPELSRFAVMQHLKVLEEANLVIVRREGRQRFNHLNAVPIRQIYERWVSRFEGHWAGALISLKDMLEAPDKPGDERRPRKSNQSPPPADDNDNGGKPRAHKRPRARRTTRPHKGGRADG